MSVDSRVGRTVAGYRTERLIGRGGMGDVYLAQHIHLGAKRALKILAPELAADEDFRERFIRESQLAASLEHPNIIPVHDAGEADGLLYIAMRYVDGMDLRQLIDLEGSLQPARAVTILAQIASALDAAHAKGLIHRDVKPGNIMIEIDGGSGSEPHVFLTDFGLVKPLQAKSRLTRTGYFVGTYDYAAPEQFRGGELDPRADQYSLGCVLYECLTRSVPFPRENEAAVMYAHLNAPPPSIRKFGRGLPDGLDEVFAKVLAKTTDDRYADCSEFIAAARARAGIELEGRLPTLPTKIARVPASMERRFVTVMFLSLVGLDDLASDIPSADFVRLMDEVNADLRKEVELRGGITHAGIGESVMAVFGSAKAREDDPESAVKTALAMHETMGRRSVGLPTPIRLRIGIVSDLVVSGAGGGGLTSVLGRAPSSAAQLQQLARPGETLVGKSVWHKVRNAYETEELSVSTRDDEALICYRVIGPREPVARRHGPLVGRRDTLAILETLWSSTVEGTPHVVSMAGDPGVGKSRLLSEFSIRQGAVDIRVRCDPDRVFGPFIDIIERVLGRLPTDIEDLAKLVGDLQMDSGAGALIGAILGLGESPAATGFVDAQQRQQMFVGLTAFLLAAFHGNPVLVAFDDLNRADRSSLEFLEFFLDRLDNVPFMVLLAFRPAFGELEFTVSRANHMLIPLDSLMPDESVALACGFLGVDELPPALKQIVVDRAEGNPFFIEELLQVLLEAESLAVDHGSASLTAVGSEIPDTIRGTILARIDRLGYLERAVLKNAAVIGRGFPLELIQAVMEREDLRASLDALVRTHLLIEREAGLWSFRNTLTEEVTYATLLPRQRRETHGKVAQAMEATTGEDPAFLKILAEHYALAQVPERAREYAIAAGDAALKRMGYIEAKRLYQSALDQWGDGDREGRCQLLMKLGWSSLIAGEPEDASTYLTEAEAGWRELGDTRRAGVALATLGRLHFFIGELDRSNEALNGAISVLEPLGPSAELVQTLAWAAILHMPTGQAGTGAALAAQGLEMAERLDIKEARPGLLTSLGTFQVLSGDPEGTDRIYAALKLAEECEDEEGIGRAYFNLGQVLAELFRNREGVAVCERGRSRMRQRGALSFEWLIAAKEAEMLVELGSYEEAEALSLETLGPQRPLLAPAATVFAQMALIRIFTRLGRYEEAEKLLPELMTSARRMGGSMFLAPALTARAELEAALGNATVAREAVEEAARLAFGSAAVTHWFRVMVPAARLLSRQEATGYLDRIRSSPNQPWFEACRTEAAAVIESDRRLFKEAAVLYESLELPYQAARCLLDAGEADQGAELAGRFHFVSGPLAAGLRRLDRG